MREPARGEAAFRQLVRDHPGWAWGYIGWAGVYWLFRPDCVPIDYEHAVSLYLEGLQHNEDPDDIEAFEEQRGRLAQCEHHRARCRSPFVLGTIGRRGRASTPSFATFTADYQFRPLVADPVSPVRGQIWNKFYQEILVDAIDRRRTKTAAPQPH